MEKMKCYEEITKIANSDKSNDANWEKTFTNLNGNKQKEASGSSYGSLLKIIDGSK